MSEQDEDPRRWRRRALSLSSLAVASALVCASLPLTLVVALARDLIARSRLAWTRCVLMIAWYLVCECWGVVALVSMWLVSPLGGRARLAHRTSQLQRRWAGAITRGLLGLFSIEIEIEGGAAVERGPLLLLVRHASVIDTLLPMWAVANPHAYRPRYAVKQELRWSPCLDIAGHRIRTAFVHRGEGAREIERVAALGEGLGPEDIVVVYPEGTRFSPRRHARRISELRARDDELFELALELRSCLPPRTGGVLGLLERAPELDVVVLAHLGLDSVRGLADIFAGALIGRRIQLGLWRVPAGEIPREREARRRWLYEQWLAVDRWVAGHERGSASPRRAAAPEPEPPAPAPAPAPARARLSPRGRAWGRRRAARRAPPR